MSDREMAYNNELIALFVAERCEILYYEDSDELIGLQVGTTLFAKKSYTCNGCHKEFVTFLETPPAYCPAHAPECITCGAPCPNGTIESLCIICFKEEVT